MPQSITSKKKSLPQNAEVFFTLIKPTPDRPGRAKFSFMQDTRHPNGKREQRVYKFPPGDDRLDSINRLYKGAPNKLDAFDHCLKLAMELKDQLLKEYGLKTARVFSQENYAVLDAFFEKKYAARKVKDKQAAYNDFRRAVDALGTLPLEIATKEQIQKVLSRYENNLQRRIASRLQMLLKHLGRDIRLDRDKKLREPVRYLSKREFAQVIREIDHAPTRALFEMAFASGCRMGELFALTPEDFRNGVLTVNKQMLRPLDAGRRKGKDAKKWAPGFQDLIAPTKTDQSRRVVVFPEFAKALDAWCKIPEDERVALRGAKFAERLTKACREVFPNNPQKHLVAHDLRHSFAIRMLERANLTYVALQLGNRIEVCQEHYTGYELHDEGISILREIMKEEK